MHEEEEEEERKKQAKKINKKEGRKRSEMAHSNNVVRFINFYWDRGRKKDGMSDN